MESAGQITVPGTVCSVLHSRTCLGHVAVAESTQAEGTPRNTLASGSGVTVPYRNEPMHHFSTGEVAARLAGRLMFM